MSEAVNAAIELCRELGAEVGETTLPRSVEYGLSCYYLIAPSEASSNLARYDGVRYGLRVTDGDVRALYMRTRDAGFGDEPKRRIMLGTYALSAGYYDAYYGQAQKVRTIIRDEFRAALEQFDLLVSPTSPTVAFPIGARVDNPLAMYLSDVLAIPPNMAGLPGLSIPCGLSDGLPVGLQLIGPQFSENLLFRAGHALEQRARVRLRPAEAEVSWEPVIGLEIHVHLKTRTKMFCRCELEYFAPENSRTCPVCLAHPGTLPVPNRRAIEMTILLGHALGCEIVEHAVFHRKHYFYPDLPKGYQISQYDEPLCVDGAFTLPTSDGDISVSIVRAHLEEDAAKNVHMGGAEGRIAGADRTLVDFNRAGTPLVEIVTGPDLHSSEHAKRFLQLLRQTVVELGISDAEMEKGSLRFDVNVSVRPEGSDELRTRTELKNMNSFNFAAKGIEREIQRQIEIYESGGEVEQETMHFDPGNESAPPLRSKEEAQDYRYLPEPDLVPLEPARELVEELRAQLPELPGARIDRIGEEVGFELAEGLVVSDRDRLFERVGGDRKAVANILMNQFAATGVDPALVNAEELSKLIMARDQVPRHVFTDALAASGDPGFSAETYLGDGQITEAGDLEPLVDQVLAANPEQVESYRSGQAGPPRLLRRPGDEGDRGPREPEARQRAPAPEARRLTARRG